MTMRQLDIWAQRLRDPYCLFQTGLPASASALPHPSTVYLLYSYIESPLFPSNGFSSHAKQNPRLDRDLQGKTESGALWTSLPLLHFTLAIPAPLLFCKASKFYIRAIILGVSSTRMFLPPDICMAGSLTSSVMLSLTTVSKISIPTN